MPRKSNARSKATVSSIDDQIAALEATKLRLQAEEMQRLERCAKAAGVMLSGVSDDALTALFKSAGETFRRAPSVAAAAPVSPITQSDGLPITAIDGRLAAEGRR